MQFGERFDQFQSFYLYGATPSVEGALNLLTKTDKKCVGVVDRDAKKQGLSCYGAPVVSPDVMLNKLSGDTGIIIVSAHQREIDQFLRGEGVDENKVFPHLDEMFFPTYRDGYSTCAVLDRVAAQLTTKEEQGFFKSWRSFKANGRIEQLKAMQSLTEQYDHKGWLKTLRCGGTALDIGAYDGATSRAMADTGMFSEVIAFEPFQENFRLLDNCAKSYKGATQIMARQLAIGAQAETFFQSHENASSRSFIDRNADATQSHEQAGETIKVCALDDLDYQDVSMIKVDIEGFELDFLKGAINTLEKWRPHLAISAYHHHSHAAKIADFLFAHFSDVTIRVGHHPHAVYELEYYVSFGR